MSLQGGRRYEPALLTTPQQFLNLAFASGANRIASTEYRKRLNRFIERPRLGIMARIKPAHSSWGLSSWVRPDVRRVGALACRKLLFWQIGRDALNIRTTVLGQDCQLASKSGREPASFNSGREAQSDAVGMESLSFPFLGI
jgi:hypothetical protein